ncbi:hypothetical protein [Enhygromyxa salina]|nr:hypothetical protein [Enhygromyxa salina]
MFDFKYLQACTLIAVVSFGCDSGDDEAGNDATETAGDTTDTTGDTTDTTGDGDGDGDAAVPSNAAELLPFLEAESYAGFAAESAVHAATGASPHGDVRVFINATLDGSLADGNAAHPVGSAAIKELYMNDARVGWAVMVKTQADSDGGNGWYWYEIMNDSVIADGNGDMTCTGCHAGTGNDFFSTVYPLQ